MAGARRPSHRRRLGVAPALAAAGLAVAAPTVLAGVPGDAALGQYLASECTTCHQISGRATGAIPPIVGLPPDHFIAAMQAYKARQRDNAIMQTIAGRLNDDEIGALAAYFGALRPQPAAP